MFSYFNWPSVLPTKDLDTSKYKKLEKIERLHAKMQAPHKNGLFKPKNTVNKK